jgi:PEP-CTERM motif
MKKTCWAGVVALAGMALVGQAQAATMPIYFSGPGVRGSLEITFGPNTDSKYSNAFEITGVSGTFSDSNNGLNIVDASVSLFPILSPPSDPEITNLLAPHDFSKFAVASGLPVMSNGFVTYDNLFWPGGAPATASDFDGAGGFLDIYGLAFTIGGGVLVDLFNNGVGADTHIPYGGFGVAVATSEKALDYVSAGVTASTPEPSTWAMMVLGFAGLGLAGYRKARKAAAIAA